jgi:hypothetical protein
MNVNAFLLRGMSGKKFGVSFEASGFPDEQDFTEDIFRLAARESSGSHRVRQPYSDPALFR